MLDTIVSWLVKQDKYLFVLINRLLTHPVLDGIMPIWREAQTWYPLYLFLLVFTLMNFGRKAFWWMLFFGLTIGLCDQVSSAFFKDFFGRLRPCRDPQFSQYARLLLNRCPSSGSFTSSHATNHFGMAVFIAQTFKGFFVKGRYAVYLWAASICYAQVYVGVHYPFDVIGGAMLGCVIGYLTSSYFIRRLGLPGAGVSYNG